MVKIALAQMHIDYDNFEINRKVGMDLITSAVNNKCKMVVMPELWSTGFKLERSPVFAEENQELIEGLQIIADQGHIEIIGSYVIKNEAKYSNEFIAFRPHSPQIRYSKIHLFPSLQEPRFLEPGKSICTFPSSLGTSGAAICFDLRFPDQFLTLAKKGAISHIIPSHWPIARINHWNVLLRARAIDTFSYVIGVNSVGKSGNVIFGGHSSVISPDGEILLQADEQKEDIFLIDLDPAVVTKTRSRYPFISSLI